MNKKVTKLRRNPVDEIVESLQELQPDELVAVVFKDGQWTVLTTEVQDCVRTLGALAMMQHHLLNES